MKKIIIAIVLLVLVWMGWAVYNTDTAEVYNKSRQLPSAVVSQQAPKKEAGIESQKKEESGNTQSNDQNYSNRSNDLSPTASPFPPPFVEKIGDVNQRTIHMGVRQWEWYPLKIESKFGENVILIMHNADITHSISIPELGVRQVIPEDGAIVKFKANKRGTFTFFCDTPCGEGHAKMKGQIIVD